MLDDIVRDLPLHAFGIAVAGKLLQVGHLTADLDAMLGRVGESAAAARKVAASPQWDPLIERADALRAEREWTVGDLGRLAEDDDPRAEALHAPLTRLLVESHAGIREMQAALFPPFVWSSVVVAVLAEWEVALRLYPQYLAHHLGLAGLGNPEALGVRLVREFKMFVNGPLDLGFDFNASSWMHMNRHREIRNLIVHWGGRLVGKNAEAHRQFIRSRPDDFELRGNLFLCQRRYAEAVAKDAIGFVSSLDRALGDRYPDLAAR